MPSLPNARSDNALSSYVDVFFRKPLLADLLASPLSNGLADVLLWPACHCAGSVRVIQHEGAGLLHRSALGAGE